MKRKLRESLKKKRLLHKKAAEHSLQIRDILYSLPEYQKAKNILFYMSIKNEVHTDDMIDFHKKIALPVTVGDNLIISEFQSFDNLTPGAYAVKEPKEIVPIDPAEIDLAIIPGIGFDQAGARLGYGKGYYDKLLPGLKAPKIGLAYSIQMVKNIPVEPHDIHMDKIITEEGVIDCDRR